MYYFFGGNKQNYCIQIMVKSHTGNWNCGLDCILEALEVGWGYKYCDLHFPQDAYDQLKLSCETNIFF